MNGTHRSRSKHLQYPAVNRDINQVVDASLATSGATAGTVLPASTLAVPFLTAMLLAALRITAFLVAAFFAAPFLATADFAAAFFAATFFTGTDTFFVTSGFDSIALSAAPAIRNFVRSLALASHAGAGPRPLHVAPVFGSRYLGACGPRT